MMTQSGNYWLTLVDNYGPSGIALLFIVFFEVIGLSWGFGNAVLFTLRTKKNSFQAPKRSRTP